MATERLISADCLMESFRRYMAKKFDKDLCVSRENCDGCYPGCLWRHIIEVEPTVDAVPVDEIKFLYMAIDKNGIPELKIQLGDRIVCLRRDNDPVDVVSVVRCKDCKHFWESFSGSHSCKLHKGLVGTKFDTFCSYGERKDND